MAAVSTLRCLCRRKGVNGARRGAVRWVLLAVGLGTLLWVPPLLEEASNRPGNLAKLVDYFGDPGATTLGLREGVELRLVHLDLWRLAAGDVLSDRSLVTGSVLPGAVLLLAWAGAVVIAWRLRHATLLRLHLVLAATLALSAVSMGRIIGEAWYYLSLWAWGIGALLAVAVGWTLGILLARASAGTGRAAPAPAWALAGVGVAASLAFSSAAADSEVPRPDLEAIVGELVAPTAEALASRPGGNEERFLVTWTDELHVGAQGFALLNELARKGFEVGAITRYRAQATEYRVLEPAQATAVVHLAVGTHRVEEWRAKPGVEEVATVDERTAGDRSQYDELQSEVVEGLEDADLSDLASRVDQNAFAVAFDPRVPEPVRVKLARMRTMPWPTAVFVGPPTSAPATP
ncbi:MAG: hypothetical protein M3R01_15450 [Actinomycetota bacterium]|nr:hypothetical protein [Actinomycetota bacterium]